MQSGKKNTSPDAVGFLDGLKTYHTVQQPKKVITKNTRNVLRWFGNKGVEMETTGQPVMKQNQISSLICKCGTEKFCREWGENLPKHCHSQAERWVHHWDIAEGKLVRKKAVGSKSLACRHTSVFDFYFYFFPPKKCMYCFDLISIEIREKAQRFVYRISGLQAQLSTAFITLLHIQWNEASEAGKSLKACGRSILCEH